MLDLQGRRATQVFVVAGCFVNVIERHQRMSEYAFHSACVDPQVLQAPVCDPPSALHTDRITREIRIPNQALRESRVPKVRTLRRVMTEQTMAVRVLRANPFGLFTRIVGHINVDIMQCAGEPEPQRIAISRSREMYHARGGEIVFIIVPKWKPFDVPARAMITIVLEAQSDTLNDGVAHISR